MEYTGKLTSPESLGRILQQARLLKGPSQRELAERLGTTQRYMWEIASGKSSIFVRRLFGLMKEVEVELSATVKAKTPHPRAHPRLAEDIRGFSQNLLDGRRVGPPASSSGQ